VTFGLAWLIYPFFAKKMIINSYLERGWSIDSGSGQATSEISKGSFTSSSSSTALPVNEPFDFKTLNPIVFGFVSLIILFATYVFNRIDVLFGIFFVTTVWDFDFSSNVSLILESILYLFFTGWAVGIGYKFQKITIIYVALTIFILNQASLYLMWDTNPLLNFYFYFPNWLYETLSFVDADNTFLKFYTIPLHLLIAVALFFLQERLKKISALNT